MEIIFKYILQFSFFVKVKEFFFSFVSVTFSYQLLYSCGCLQLVFQLIVIQECLIWSHSFMIYIYIILLMKKLSLYKLPTIYYYINK